MSDTATLFAPLEDADPATPGDPFSRLRYSYGQLLGAEDFAAEQRYHLLRERLLTATLHGHGTVWGLRVTAREDATNNTVQLVCAPGLAVDALGRLIHVEQEVCLDVTGLALAPFWSDLAPPPTPPAAEQPEEEEPDEGGDDTTSGEETTSGEDTTPGGDTISGADSVPGGDDDEAEPTPETRVRRAYVVLSYRACLADEVPAITPPCSTSGEATAYARVLDRWRLCLMAEAPPDPHPLARDWTTFAGNGDLRTRLLNFILDPPAQLSRFWSGADEAPLLLATVDLEPVGDPAERTRLVAGPDNAVRALLPDVQTLAAMTTGLRLLGPGGAQPFRLVSVAARSEGGQVVLDARFTTPPDSTSLSADAIRIFRRDGTGAWVPATFNGWAVPSDGNGLAMITIGEDWTEATTYQLLLRGAGAAPLLDANGQPLSGLDGEPPLPAGAGRDVSLVQRFEP
ncbi:hypothetical protein [Roseomonas sp. AR75]|uniref:hypothetical protein n=1 Tax=Roseomonas sp. AR75 TaxID=2562311 RepID=UPI0010C123CC|nr:hypothetical protein [Roseomonas sp. AR75]